MPRRRKELTVTPIETNGSSDHKYAAAQESDKFSESAPSPLKPTRQIAEISSGDNDNKSDDASDKLAPISIPQTPHNAPVAEDESPTIPEFKSRRNNIARMKKEIARAEFDAEEAQVREEYRLKVLERAQQLKRKREDEIKEVRREVNHRNSLFHRMFSVD